MKDFIILNNIAGDENVIRVVDVKDVKKYTNDNGGDPVTVFDLTRYSTTTIIHLTEDSYNYVVSVIAEPVITVESVQEDSEKQGK